jgi:hypothetical protein
MLLFEGHAQKIMLNTQAFARTSAPASRCNSSNQTASDQNQITRKVRSVDTINEGHDGTSNA